MTDSALASSPAEAGGGWKSALLVWAIPAVLVAVLVSIAEPFTNVLPHRDDWRLLEAYRLILTGEESWTSIFDLHMGHLYVLTRAVIYPFVSLTGGDLASLRIFAFVVCALICWQLIRLARPVLRGAPLKTGIWAALTTLVVFSPAQVLIWTWGMIYANAVPWLCLTSAMLVMRRRMSWGMTFFWSALLALTATFHFGYGLMSWIVLPIFYWLTPRPENRLQRVKFTLAWGITVLLVVGLYVWRWYEWRQVWADKRGMTLETLLERPWGVVHYILSLLGALPAVGTPVFAYESAPVFGGLFVFLFAVGTIYVLWKWRDRELVAAAAPWFCLGLAALGAAVLICIGRIGNTSATAHSPHFQTACLYFGLASLFFAGTVIDHRWGARALSGVGAGIVYGAIALVLGAGWVRGRQEMRHFHAEVIQKQAALAFLDVLPFERLDPLAFDSVYGKPIVDYLREKDWLRKAYYLKDGSLGSFRVSGQRVKPRWADVREVATLEDGTQVVRGHAILSEWRRPSDLVILMARKADDPPEEARVFDLVRPRTERYESIRSRGYLDLVASWEYEVNPERFPAGDQVVSCYTFEYPKRKVAAFGPELRFRDGQFIGRTGEKGDADDGE